MIRFSVIILLLGVLASCRSARPIQNVIAKKDTTIAMQPSERPVEKRDTLQGVINATLQQLAANRIDFRTFSAKVGVDYQGGDGKKYDLNANLRMLKDSIIWINVNALMGFDAMRVMITKDSVKLINKLDKVYLERSVDYLQDVTALPLDLKTVQDLLIGNAVFVDSNVIAYNNLGDRVSLMSLGEWFKTLLTLSSNEKLVLHSKMDDVDPGRSRTAELSYEAYETKKGVPFATKRRITVAEKTRLDIRLDFKQYEFNEEVSFPFSIPKNYSRN